MPLSSLSQPSTYPPTNLPTHTHTHTHTPHYTSLLHPLPLTQVYLSAFFIHFFFLILLSYAFRIFLSLSLLLFQRMHQATLHSATLHFGHILDELPHNFCINQFNVNFNADITLTINVKLLKKNTHNVFNLIYTTYYFFLYVSTIIPLFNCFCNEKTNKNNNKNNPAISLLCVQVTLTLTYRQIPERM